ncbi:MAG TPA: PAC2 family protein [Candidatus Nanoarchaeia archaeon]|nr:PAC2 family protein [Candidatus Nanoarchaeia archaeon]
MSSHWEFILETKVKPDLIKPIFIEGLPGIGNVGKIAVDFLIEELKAKKLGSFFSYKFPHSVFVNENNLIEMPKIELYYKKFSSSTKNNKKRPNSKTQELKRDLLILTGDIQPIDEESCYTFCEEVLKLVQLYSCTEIITTGGIGLPSIPDPQRVFCTANDQKLFEAYVKKGMGVEKEIFGVVGPIVGVSGVLLGLGKKRGVKGVALLAETFGHPLHLGIKGAKEILRVIEHKFNYGINLKRMTKEIIEVEQELIQKTKEWAAESLAGAPPGAKLKDKSVSYIG